MEESWVVKNTRKREYFHHIASLDRIYMQDGQKKKVKDVIEKMDRLRKVKQQSNEREREQEHQVIEKENELQNKFQLQRREHYENHILAPQIGKVSKGKLGKGKKMSFGYTFRRGEEKRIQEENLRMSTRLFFAKSIISNRPIDRSVSKQNKPFKMKLTTSTHFNQDNKKDEQPIKKPHILRTLRSTIQQEGFTSKIRKLKKGPIFKEIKSSPNFHFNSEKKKRELESMLEVLKNRRKQAESSWTIFPKKSKTNSLASLDPTSFGKKKEDITYPPNSIPLPVNTLSMDKTQNVPIPHKQYLISIVDESSHNQQAFPSNFS